MSNPSAITPAATPVTGYMNSLFEESEDRVGDKQRSTCLKQAPLLRVGTAARDAFDQNNLMTFKVRFKIYTDTEVNINAPNQSTPKVGASKKVPESSKLNLIDSKAINAGYLKTKICVFGKSLNEFKELVAGACEKYEAGMKNVILNSHFLPDLKWKATIGRIKSVLTNFDQWQNLVDALEKSTKKMCTILIENENVQVKAKDKASIRD
ncbi:uncharacterized protein MELLADRAFT_94872 [Melampsora larici-populina 98AG31]|uniref:Uncharacterized protein n=1 Tax=Melampsora larici-populina (strain 98AG31 / pathotype 3-4-7) TaxID=747676 RepID=F4S882_MELLP|nr:uncharacterized protein MELLADRAFT_94872 [Melampsora larici-populina 98AG31]EGF99161.1 hypothetical protein MELLADRAFT_94872 [Melampsora larici-populina 98AG31]